MVNGEKKTNGQADSKCRRWLKNKESYRQEVKKCQKSDEQTQNGKSGKKTKRQTHGS